MSEGPLTELVALGAQNEDLVSNDPNYSIFQDPIKKITNFSKSSFINHHKGQFNWGSTIKFEIERKGDLLSTCYLVLELPTLSVENLETPAFADPNDTNEVLSPYYVTWSNVLGYALIEKASIRIGGQLIDEQAGEYMQLVTDMRDDWNRFYMLGHDGVHNRPARRIDGQKIYIPLKFWFTQNINKALPLVALQYHKVEIEIKIRDFDQITNVLKLVQDENGTNTLIHTDIKLKKSPIKSSNLDCTYIFLSPEERKKIAESEHKILITQTQERKYNLNSNIFELDFNHTVKEIFFFIQSRNNLDEGEIFNFSGKLGYPSKKFLKTIEYNDELIHPFSKNIWDEIPKTHHIEQARILLNGHERVQWKDYKYFYYVQPYENFKNPNEHHYYIYSFSANSRALGNYGGCNFSRIDNAQLQLKLNKTTQRRVSAKTNTTLKMNKRGDDVLSIYAQNYNFLIIKNGMAGLQFNN